MGGGGFVFLLHLRAEVVQLEASSSKRVLGVAKLWAVGGLRLAPSVLSGATAQPPWKGREGGHLHTL